MSEHDAARDALIARLPAGDLWVFAYGSLMWNPSFEYLRSAPALLRGYRRAFCVTSTRFRGTPENPGLVLGLDRGGACRGIAFLVAAPNVKSVVADLWAREMSRLVYVPKLVPVEIGEGKVRALAFLADRAHEAYVPDMQIADVARRIATCCGAGGPNIDYLANTLSHLDELGIREPGLHRVLDAVLALSTEKRGS